MPNSHEPTRLTRRLFVLKTSISAAGFALGCGSDPIGTDPDVGVGTDAGMGTDSRVPGEDAATGEDVAAPTELAWRTIPSLTFVVGVPVNINLRAHLDDPSGSAVIRLDMPLPDGLTVEDGLITGTPSGVTPAATYIASADDGL